MQKCESKFKFEKTASQGAFSAATIMKLEWFSSLIALSLEWCSYPKPLLGVKVT